MPILVFSYTGVLSGGCPPGGWAEGLLGLVAGLCTRDLGLCLQAAGPLTLLFLQHCLEVEYTQAPQSSKAATEPTLAGEDPQQAPENLTPVLTPQWAHAGGARHCLSRVLPQS